MNIEIKRDGESPVIGYDHTNFYVKLLKVELTMKIYCFGHYIRTDSMMAVQKMPVKGVVRVPASWSYLDNQEMMLSQLVGSSLH